MLKRLKALSALLIYPTKELQHACGEISEAIEAETAIPLIVRDRLHKLLTELATDDIYDLQETLACILEPHAFVVAALFEHVMARAATAAKR